MPSHQGCRDNGAKTVYSWKRRLVSSRRSSEAVSAAHHSLLVRPGPPWSRRRPRPKVMSRPRSSDSCRSPRGALARLPAGVRRLRLRSRRRRRAPAGNFYALPSLRCVPSIPSRVRPRINGHLRHRRLLPPRGLTRASLPVYTSSSRVLLLLSVSAVSEPAAQTAGAARRRLLRVRTLRRRSASGRRRRPPEPAGLRSL